MAAALCAQTFLGASLRSVVPTKGQVMACTLPTEWFPLVCFPSCLTCMYLDSGRAAVLGIAYSQQALAPGAEARILGSWHPLSVAA